MNTESTLQSGCRAASCSLPHYIPFHVSHFGSKATKRPYGVAVRIGKGYLPWKNPPLWGSSRFDTLEKAQARADELNRFHEAHTQSPPAH